MDLTNLYNMINFNLAALDQLNVPPAFEGSGRLFPGVGQNSAISVTINMFLCPSSPADPKINYVAALTKIEMGPCIDSRRNWHCGRG